MRLTIAILVLIIIGAIMILTINFNWRLDGSLTQNSAKMINRVKASRTPLVKKYDNRYDLLSAKAEEGLNNEQNYVLPNFMGQDYFKGFSDMDTYNELQFPRDHNAQLDFQFGWYFWSGNFLDNDSNEIDVVIVFFRRALYPPPIATELGITDIENQLVETVVAVNYSDKNLHITGSKPIISGSSGRIKYGIEPFIAQVGSNSAKSLQKETMFPMEIYVEDPSNELIIDLDLKESKPLLLQGDKGKIPSIFGLGTWYYSFPNIKTTGTVVYKGEKRNLRGKMWMDHQWMAGIAPIGYPKNIMIQAIANIKAGMTGNSPDSFGWDWADIQFDDDTEITFASPHSASTDKLKNKGVNPPDTITRNITGKYIDENGKGEDIVGTVHITKWMRSPKSGAWYPNGWEVTISQKKLEFSMVSTVDDQFIYSVGSEIREGGVFVSGTKDGKKITGYGFGEGVKYSGQDFYLNENISILGIENNAINRKLLKPSPPGTLLIIQSSIVLISPVLLVVLIILVIIKLIRRKQKTQSN